jgi:integrase
MVRPRWNTKRTSPEEVPRNRAERALRCEGSPRLLRHTPAALALRAGIQPEVVCERLEHATVAITLDTYSHAIPSLQEEAAVRIAELVFAEN